MEWVETTGKTVDEAKEAALDQLGVHEDDAELEVLEEPRVGLFGRMRGEARVRARVRPTRPRPKAERRDRRRRRPERGERSDRGERGDRAERGERTRASTPGGGASTATETDGEAAGQSDEARQSRNRRRRGGRGRGGSGSGRRPAGEEGLTGDEEGSSMAREADPENDATVEEQAAIMRTFLEGLVEAFDLEGDLVEERVDDETIELKVEGDNLGLLIGPKGQTLQAVQELARTVVQRQASGTHHGRVRIDIGGYRERRREALERFARQVAADVVASGAAKALEPMHPADRKVVHDTVNDIDGVETTSEGEEPRRRVVIRPATADAS
jgi:spoIIIJ-associated protein